MHLALLATRVTRLCRVRRHLVMRARRAMEEAQQPQTRKAVLPARLEPTRLVAVMRHVRHVTQVTLLRAQALPLLHLAACVRRATTAQ